MSLSSGPLVACLLVALGSTVSAQQPAPGPGPSGSPATVANFRLHPPSGEAPLVVRFEDRSLGEPTSWQWDFGDGARSSLQHPTHTYSEGGLYTVRLTVHGPAGQDTLNRPEAVTVRQCVSFNARANDVTPLELGAEFVPVTGDDALGFYCVYSGKAVSATNSGVANNVGMFVLPLVGGEVLLFGAGYGDPNALVTPTADAAHDVRRIDAILRFCYGLEPATTPIRFVAPHGHIDHINPDFIRELRARNYPVTDIYVHQADLSAARSLDGWTPSDLALFRTLRNTSSQCQEELLTLASPLGRLWFNLRAGHTAGSIDLVIDVRGDPTNRFVVRGSGAAFGACSIPGVREAIEPHGNVQFISPAPTLSGANPADVSALGGTLVTFSGSGFAAHLAGLPQVFFNGVPAGSVTVVDDGTLTCLAPPGTPGTPIVVTLLNRSGRASLEPLSFRPLPTLSGITPARGLASGGARVTLMGAGFQAFAPGTNTVRFGGLPATGVVVQDDHTLLCTAPAHAAGNVDVTLSNGNGTAAIASAFTYDPVIEVTSVSPASGSALGGTRVALDGSAFSVGASLPEVFFGSAPATDVLRQSNTRLLCTTPAGPSGLEVAVRVSGENGSDTLANGYRYFIQPRVSEVAPASGPLAGGTTVLLTGLAFTRNSAGANAVFFGNVAAASVTTLSDSQIRCVVPPGTGGTRVDVVVRNANGNGTLPEGYRYHAPPHLAALEPTLGPREGGTLLTARGSGFAELASGVTTLTLGGLACTELVVIDDATFTCRTPAHTNDGTVDARVSNANGVHVLPQAYRYLIRPELNDLSPAQGAARGGELVLLHGRGFRASGAGVPEVRFARALANDVRVLDDFTVSCRSPLGLPGSTVHVFLSNANGRASLSNAFTYLALPAVSAVRPDQGAVVGGTRVRVLGRGFSGPSTPQVFFGLLAATNVLVLSDNELDCTTPSGARGPVDVRLRTAAGDALLREGFVYGSTVPVVARLTPNHGPAAGGGAVELEGSGFTASSAGVNRITFGGLAATNVVAVNDGKVTCTVPAGTPGSSVEIRLTNLNGSAALAAGYRYHLVPTLAAVSPASASPLGGTWITLTGTGFVVDGAAGHIVRFGPSSASALEILDDGRMRCLLPPGAPGAVVDVELALSNGTARLAAAFTYQAAPRLDALAPASGSPLGGQLVTLSGAGFALAGAGPPTVRFGGTLASSVQVESDSEITCLAPNGPAGTHVDVQVVNANGEATRSAAYRYFAGPTIASLAPGSGPAAGGTTVVILGTGFRTEVLGPNAVTFGGRPARSVTTVDDTRVRAVTPTGVAGRAVDLALSNSNGVASVVAGFRYHSAPVLASLDPPGASSLGGTTLTLHGAGFQRDAPGANHVFFGAIETAAVTVVDDVTLTCSVPSGGAGTSVLVTLTNANGATSALPFQYHAAPALGALAPAFGPSTGGNWVELHGSGWLASSAGSNMVQFGLFPASEVTVVDDTILRCRAPLGATGPVRVRVDNANGATELVDAYYYDWAPNLTGIQPAQGSSLGGSEVRLSGAGFATAGAGPLSVRFGSNPATNVRVLDGSTVLCDAPSGSAGSLVNVVASNTHGTTSFSGFRYFARPEITGLDPATGPPPGGNLVTLSGSGFVSNGAGLPLVRFGGAAASSVSVLDDATVTCLAPAGVARTLADVTLDNANGNATFVAGYRWIVRESTDLNDDGISDAVVAGLDTVGLHFGDAFGLASENSSAADLVLRASVSLTDFGAELASGDLNGDQLADLIVAAPLDDVGGTDTGAVYVFFGPLSASPTPRFSSSANAILRGAASGDRFGASLELADVNGDGLRDLIVGAPGNDAAGTDAGAVYIYRGRAGFAGQTTAQATVRLIASGSQHAFGSSVAAGDVSGDGIADVLVGAPNQGVTGGQSGAAYVFRGGTSVLVSMSSANAAVQVAGGGSNEHFGTSVESADLDGDGIDELVVGAPDARVGGVQGGLVACFRGGAGLVSGVAPAARFDGEVSGDRLGQVLAVGEVNGDARADLLVGAPFQDVPAANAGRAYLLLGGPLLGGPVASRAAMLITAENSTGDQLGAALGIADIDGDGRGDVLVGAPFNNGGGSDAGRMYVFFGSALQATRSANADDVTLSGASVGLLYGRALLSTR